MMGVSSALSIADSETLDSFVTPVNLLKAVTQFVMTSGRGLRADFFNDTEKGASEVWNQPVYSAEVKVDAVTADVAKAVIAYAEKKGPSFPPLPASRGVKLVQITAYWGVEVSDSHEGPAKLSKSTWAFYAVTDTAAGDAAVKGYMAHHLAKEGLSGLPVTTSDPLPDYYAFPKHALVDDALKGVANTLLDNANEGPYNRFMVGTVLPRGIPDEVRAAFEGDFFAGDAAAELKQRYPGVANAYSPSQWQAVFAAKLGAGTEFGAVWGEGKP